MPTAARRRGGGAPTHCCGDLARAVFDDAFATNYVEAGVGPVLTS